MPRPGEPDGVLHVPGGGVVPVRLAGGAAVVRRGAAAAAAAADPRRPPRPLPLPRAVPVSALLRQEGRGQPQHEEADVLPRPQRGLWRCRAAELVLHTAAAVDTSTLLAVGAVKSCVPLTI